MFIQVIQGKVTDADGLRAAVQRWQDTMAPQVPGWQGTTGGVTDDGTAIAVVRFESEQAARANSERPEQSEWWSQASRHFTGEVTFHDCPDAFTLLDGGSDQAGFVQVIQGRATDAGRLRELVDRTPDALRQLRPEIIGGTIGVHSDDGRFTETVYFTSEQAARGGETKEPPPEMKADFEEMMSLLDDATFYDLPRPWFFSAG